jgi:tricorn protease
MRRVWVGVIGCLPWVALGARGGPAQEAAGGVVEGRPAFAEPGIAPDGREIAVVSGGDIWTVPAAGGEARLLVSHPATESRPLFSPDGRRLAFVSTRTGAGDIYVLELATGRLARLTWDDGPELLDGWSPDGRFVYFSSASLDIAGMNDLFRVPADGGTPMPVSAERYVNEFFAAPAPDGTRVAFVARGNASAQWWRNGRSHLDESELWLLGGGESPSYVRVMPKGAKQLWPMWSPDGRRLYFVSDRDGHENLWVRPLEGGEATRLTAFRDGRVLWPTITRDGRTIAFERDFGVWTCDTSTGAVKALAITRRGAPAGPGVEPLTLTSDFSDLSLSPDGQKVAFVARGEVFAASAKEGGDAVRVTRTVAVEADPVWAPDSRRLAYVSHRDGAPRLYLYDFAGERETRLTEGPGRDEAPRFSPDGRVLAFVRDQRELRALDLETRQERVLATGRFGDPLGARAPAWSPDGRWLAILATGERSFTNVVLVPASGGVPRPVSFLANVFAGGVSWAPDGTFLLFDTRQRTESGQLARVDLVLRPPRFREDLFRDLFQPEPARPAPRPAEAAATTRPERAPAGPVEVVFEGIRRRLSLVPVGVDVVAQRVSPDGKWVVLIAGAEGQQNLYAYSLDELAPERPVARQLTATRAPKADLAIAPDSREVYYLEDGRIRAVSIDRGESRAITVRAALDVDFAQERREVFRQAWTLQRDNFYDPTFHGVDWAAVGRRFEPYAAGAATRDELRRVLALMVGELDASHLGVSAPGGEEPTTGRLGLRFDRAEYERRGRLRIAEVIELGPAAVTRQIAVGDYLLAVDGEPVGAGTNLDARLDRTVGRRVVLTVAASPDGAGRREVAVKPVDRAAEKALVYRQWVEANRALVERASGGRLGYVHMLNMSQAALEQLYLDLDADNHGREGVVIDIRNNSGGFVNVYAIDVLARRSYLTMTLRGQPASPARVVLGQRALERPTVLVTNQHSLSDAEDFTEGYRALKLGPVVGEPTAGWIIYTWNARLLDGTTFRLPRMRVTDSQGRDMERHPRPVDVVVERPLGEGAAGRDSQLEAAVRELLRRLGPAK